MTMTGNKKIANPNIQAIYDLTPMQEGMLYSKMLDENSSEYVIQIVMKMKKPLKREIVKVSLSLLLERYDVLRTMFFYGKTEKPKQIILRERKKYFRYVDLAEKEVTLEQYLKQDVARGFDLQKDTLIRVSMLVTPEEEQVLSWTMHHIIMDGWCTGMLFQTFFEYYHRLLAGEDIESIRQQIRKEKGRETSYEEYIRWLSRQELGRAKTYFKELLTGYDVPTGIESYLKQSSGQKCAEEFCLSGSKTVSAELVTKARENNVTVSTILETAWGIVLQNYNHAEDAVFGKVVSGRNANLPGIEHTLGLFVNTIPVRVKVDKGKKISTLLMEMQEQAVAGTSYDYCPLSEVLKEQELGNQLFQTIFVFENFEQGSPSVSSEDMPEIMKSREETNYPISVNTALGEVLQIKIMYDASLYQQVEIEKLGKRYLWTIEQMIHNPEREVSQLKLLTKEEQEALLKQKPWDGTYSEETLLSLLKKQVILSPDKTALVYGGQRMSYKELLSCAENLAGIIKSRKPAKEQYVLLMAEHSMEMILAMYAIMKLGAGYVPVDPDYPKDRIASIMESCHASLILTALPEKEADIPQEAQVLDLLNSNMWESHTSVSNRCTPDSPAYAIFTSGTSGKPKGVQVTQKNVVNFVYAGDENVFQHAVATCCNSVYLTNKIIFDITMQEIFLPLSLGKTVILSKSELEEITPVQTSIMEEFAPVAMILTPTKLNAYLGMKSFVNVLKHAGVIMAGAECFELSVVAKIHKYSKAKIFNGYGPTETTCGVSYYEVQEEDDYAPIGKPIHGVDYYVMNGERICGTGMTGELCIAGASVTEGYLGEPEQTKKVFPKNPFGEGNLYHTGDLVRWNSDGNLEYLERMDQQVKIRGYRIERQEIVSVIGQVPGVVDAAVTVHREKSGKVSLWGFYVAESNLDQEVVASYIRRKVPDYMVPSVLMQLDKIPMTATGKLDEKQLNAYEISVKQEWKKPETKLESYLCSYLKELNHSEIGTNCRFFEAGGDSISAMSLASKLREQGYCAEVRDFMKNPTVKELATKIKCRTEETSVVEKDFSISDNLLSRQEFLLTKSYDMSRLYDENRQGKVLECEYKPFSYMSHFLQEEKENVSFVKLLLKGKMEVDTIKAAVVHIVKSHSIFRTVYCKERNCLQEFSAENWNIPVLKEWDGSCVMESDSLLKNWEEFFGEEHLLSKIFIAHGTEQSMVSFYIHHCIWDGVSTDVLADEFRNVVKNPNAALEEDRYSCYAMERFGQENQQSPSLENEKFTECVTGFRASVAGTLPPKMLEIRMSKSALRWQQRISRLEEWVMGLLETINQWESVITYPVLQIYHGRTEQEFGKLGMYLQLNTFIYERNAHCMELCSSDMLASRPEYLPFLIGINYLGMVEGLVSKNEKNQSAKVSWKQTTPRLVVEIKENEEEVMIQLPSYCEELDLIQKRIENYIAL